MSFIVAPLFQKNLFLNKFVKHITPCSQICGGCKSITPECCVILADLIDVFDIFLENRPLIYFTPKMVKLLLP